jgi:methyl-accepting chemotaxis protein
MKRLFYRIAAVLMMVSALLGWVISVGGIVLTWRVEPQVSSGLVTTARALDDTLAATEGLLRVADVSLAQTEKTLVLVEATVDTMATTLEATSQVTSAVADVMGDTLGDMVKGTRAALNTMTKTARLIDDTLSFVAAVPIVGRKYEPDVPLSDSVRDVSDSMDDLPTALGQMSVDMQTTSGSLVQLSKDTRDLASTLTDIKTNLVETRSVVESYQTTVADLRDMTANAIINLPNWVKVAGWSITLLLVWVFLAQVAIFLYGWELFKAPRAAVELIAIDKPADEALAAAEEVEPITEESALPQEEEK